MSWVLGVWSGRGDCSTFLLCLLHVSSQKGNTCWERGCPTRLHSLSDEAPVTIPRGSGHCPTSLQSLSHEALDIVRITPATIPRGSGHCPTTLQSLSHEATDDTPVTIRRGSDHRPTTLQSLFDEAPVTIWRDSSRHYPTRRWSLSDETLTTVWWSFGHYLTLKSLRSLWSLILSSQRFQSYR